MCLPFNLLSPKFVSFLHIKTPLCTPMSESETTSAFKLESDKGRRNRKVRRALEKDHFLLSLAFKGLKRTALMRNLK